MRRQHSLVVIALLAVSWSMLSCNGDAGRGEVPAGVNARPQNDDVLLVRDQLIFEALANDNLMRRKAKGDFALAFPFEFDYWTNAVGQNGPVTIYIYARPPLPQTDPRYPALERVMHDMFRDLRDDIRDGVTTTLLDFPEFEEYRRRGVEVVLRTEPRLDEPARELLLTRLAAQ